MTTATATITGTITVPSQAKAASVTVKFAPYTENLRLVHPDGVVEGWELVKIDPAAGTWSIDLPLTGQAGVSPAGALWQAQERATNGAIETTVFDLTGDIDWGDIVPVADLPVTPSVLQEAVAARDAALAAEAAAQAAATAAEAVGTLADSQIAGKVNDTTPSATRAALDATYAPQLTALMSAMGGRPVFWDDFARPDQTLAILQSGTVAPSGQLYHVDDNQTTALISDGALVWSNETLASSYLQGGRILSATLDQIPDVIAGDFTMTSGTTRQQNATFGTCWNTFTFGAVQFCAFPDSWELFLSVSNTPSTGATLINLATGPLSLRMDDGTTHRLVMRCDLSTSTVTVEIDNVQVCQYADPRIAVLWGTTVCFQERRMATADGSNNNADGHVQWRRVAATSPQPSPLGAVNGINMPAAAYLAATPPAGFAPTDLQMVIDCDPTGGWVSTLSDLMGWGHVASNDYGYRVAKSSAGHIQLYVSTDGSNHPSAVTNNVVPAAAKRIKVTYRASGGTFNAYWNGDATYDPTSATTVWTKIGTTSPVIGSGGNPHIPARTTPLMVGAFDATKTTMFGGLLRGAWIFDGITRVVTDLVTTSGSTTVTSATAAFTSADNGRPVSGTNIQAGTTMTYVDATHATLSLKATAAGTGGTLTVGGIVAGTATQTQYSPAHWYGVAGNLWTIVGTGWSWAVPTPLSYGTLANLPATAADSAVYVATDQNGGTPYQMEGGTWTKMAAAVNDPGLSAAGVFLGELATPGFTVNNTTTDTTVFTGTSVAAGSLVAGKTCIRLRIGGTLTSIASGGIFNAHVKVNNGNIITFALCPSLTSAASGLNWFVDCDLYADVTGSGGSVSVLGLAGILTSTSAAKGTNAFSAIGVARDLSAGLAVSLTISMATADPGNSVVAQRGICQQVA